MGDGNSVRATEALPLIVGARADLRPVMERVAQVAKSDVPVLILGETGSGKELIARAIHAGSRRAGRPFHRVNCGAIPPELTDSELFGHDKGAFTGATDRRRGWFERADTGTLLLDEVGELPMAAQVRLLRVLQDGTFERVGGQRHLSADVRIIAATHQDLPSMVAERRFREDLWYRLAVFPIRLPAVRERPADIAALAEHLAAKACQRYGTLPIHPSESDLAILRAYRWPGNVREMGAVMDRAIILGDGKRLEIAKALGLLPFVSETLATSVSGPAAPSAATTEFPTLDAVVAGHIRLALERSGGRVEGPRGVAAMLAVNPHTLRARMRRLGIDWSAYRRRPQRHGRNG
jgi:transcriptional regulator with GAF, ATPase, and Fis domain